MAYDHELADRIRFGLASRSDVTERAMFGGLAFLVSRHMAVVVSGQGGLMVRVIEGEVDALVATTPAYRAEMRGRAMRNWLRIDGEHVDEDDQLDRWVAVGVAAAAALPPKE